MILSAEIIAIITLYTGDIVVAQVLRKYMTTEIYRTILLTKRSILVYGEIQSGKTAAIIDIIHNPIYSQMKKIVITQNSLLVLTQYKERFTHANIKHQIIDKTTQKIDTDVIILMNNTYRYYHFLRAISVSKMIEPEKTVQKYIIIMDEADAYGEHPLAENALHKYYVTATPYNKYYKVPEYFNHIQQIQPPNNYQGLLNVNIKYDDNTIDKIVHQFYQETKPKGGGMMLINCFQYVTEMRETAVILTKMFPTICFVTLNSKRNVYIKNKQYTLRKKSITSIIDFLKDAPHIVFIANRLSLRGLSYTSGNYKRHLTHQYSNLYQKNVTNSLQRMRIFGIYSDKQPITLILPTNNQKIVNKMISTLYQEYELNRKFNIQK